MYMPNVMSFIFESKKMYQTNRKYLETLSKKNHIKDILY